MEKLKKVTNSITQKPLASNGFNSKAIAFDSKIPDNFVIPMTEVLEPFTMEDIGAFWYVKKFNEPIVTTKATVLAFKEHKNKKQKVDIYHTQQYWKLTVMLDDKPPEKELEEIKPKTYQRLLKLSENTKKMISNIKKVDDTFEEIYLSKLPPIAKSQDILKKWKTEKGRKENKLKRVLYLSTEEEMPNVHLMTFNLPASSIKKNANDPYYSEYKGPKKIAEEPIINHTKVFYADDLAAELGEDPKKELPYDLWEKHIRNGAIIKINIKYGGFSYSDKGCKIRTIMNRIWIVKLSTKENVTYKRDENDDLLKDDPEEEEEKEKEEGENESENERENERENGGTVEIDANGNPVKKRKNEGSSQDDNN